MQLARRIAVIILGSLSFIAGLNLGVPALGSLARYVVYARPQVIDGVALKSGAPVSPVLGLVLSSFLGLLLAAAGIALIIRYR
jgi:hypothetical protein